MPSPAGLTKEVRAGAFQVVEVAEAGPLGDLANQRLEERLALSEGDTPQVVTVEVGEIEEVVGEDGGPFAGQRPRERLGIRRGRQARPRRARRRPAGWPPAAGGPRRRPSGVCARPPAAAVRPWDRGGARHRGRRARAAALRGLSSGAASRRPPAALAGWWPGAGGAAPGRRPAWPRRCRSDRPARGWSARRANECPWISSSVRCVATLSGCSSVTMPAASGRVSPSFSLMSSQLRSSSAPPRGPRGLIQPARIHRVAWCPSTRGLQVSRGEGLVRIGVLRLPGPAVPQEHRPAAVLPLGTIPSKSA